MNTQYQLCFYSGSLTGKVFPIVKEETKIGRDSSCDIVLTENSVSRIHVFLYVQQNGSVVLVDNNSTNGTVVNANQISAPVQLSENDVIGLGGNVMMVFQKVAGFDPGNQWSGTDMPAGNAPESYNFEKKQGNPMNNENNTNDGAMNGFAPANGQDQQPAADSYGFNQAYNMNGMNPVQQMPYGYNQQNAFGQNNGGFYNQTPMQNTGMPTDGYGFGSASFSDAQNTNSAVPEMPSVQPEGTGLNSDPMSQQQISGSQGQSGFSANPYYQQPAMGQQNPYGMNPYSQQQPLMGQQFPYGFDNYGQQMPQQPQPMQAQNDPFSQQMNQQAQMNNPAEPFSQSQHQMPGQQMPFGNDPYGQQQMMGQQMPFGNDPYGQQQMMGQQMPYGNNPYGQQQMMGQQMPYGNNPYAQQQYPDMQGQQSEDTGKKKNKKLFIILGIILLVLILIGAFIFYIDHNRLWCDVLPFLFSADSCANYVK